MKSNKNNKNNIYNKYATIFAFVVILSIFSLYFIVSFYKFYFISLSFTIKAYLLCSFFAALLLYPFLKQILAQRYTVKTWLFISASVAIHLLLLVLIANGTFFKLKTTNVTLKVSELDYSGKDNSYYALIHYKGFRQRIFIEEKDKNKIEATKQITLKIDSCYFNCEYNGGYIRPN